jgi:hypothetical protein
MSKLDVINKLRSDDFQETKISLLAKLKGAK